ncbi:2438_t:CDS:2, partial [Funneliformis geosporum]
YCSVKLGRRLDKLKKDIKDNKDEQYIKSFLEFLKSSEINADNLDKIDEYEMITACCEIEYINVLSKEHNEFIAVSKKCCYLCESYIKFLRSKKYKITISEVHKNLYSGWKLPNTYSKEFVKSADSDNLKRNYVAMKKVTKDAIQIKANSNL